MATPRDLAPETAAEREEKSNERIHDEKVDADEQPFLSHLLELRQRLIRSLLVVFLGFFPVFYFIDPIFDFVTGPMRAALSANMIATQVASPFLTPLKLAIYTTIFATIPALLHQAWGFVSPGLYLREKRFAVPLLVSSVTLFYLGMAFAYFVVFPLVFRFFAGITPTGVDMMTDINHYLDFVLKMFFAFGIAFEIPVATVLLAKTGLVSATSMARKRPYVIVGCFVVAMLLTPPDVISQILLAVPAWLLFEVGIVLARMMEAQAAADDADTHRPASPPVEESEPDPYTVRHGESHAPPSSFRARIRYLGPSLIVTGAVIGSGELVLTTTLGAAAGWALLWWLLLSCWCKSLVQAEMARYTIISGDTYLRAINRLPGRIWRISWPIWLGLIAYVPGTMGLGGIIGGAGQAMSFLASLANFTVDGVVCTGVIALTATVVLSTGSYRWLERVMLPLVLAFTAATLICAVAMQFTPFQTTPAEIVGGLKPDFAIFVALAALALSAYGYTGTTSGDISAYTYWCIEKGYPSYVGSDRSDPAWESHARGWMRVLHTDVWLALIIVTCATVPYYVLGAGVLNKMGIVPEGNDATIQALSNIFTQTLGAWAVWLFSVGAFFILFSTVLSGVRAGGRFIPDYLIEMRLMRRSNLSLRRAIIRWYLATLPVVAFVIYLVEPDFVALIMIGGLTSAIFLPIQSGATIWLQAKHLDPRIRPRAFTRYGLWAIFIFEFLMAAFVVRYVVLAGLFD